MKRVGLLLSFVLIVTLFVAGTLSVQAQVGGPITEIEPNDSCQLAQDLSAQALPLVVSGVLPGQSFGYPGPNSELNIDFFRVRGEPGSSLLIRVDGAETGGGTLFNAQLGLVGSECGPPSTYTGQPSGPTQAVFTVPADGFVHIGVTGCCDSTFLSGGFGAGSYTLSVGPAQSSGPITGRLLDDTTGAPVTLAQAGFAIVQLYPCDPFNPCSPVTQAVVADDGSFNIPASAQLLPGQYWFNVITASYESLVAGPFTLDAGQALSVDLRLKPFTEVFGQVVLAGGAPPPVLDLVAATLLRCEDLCFPIGSTWVGFDGSFSFSSQFSPLLANGGSFQVSLSSAYYESATIGPFQVEPGRRTDLGATTLQRLPSIGGIVGRLLDADTLRPISSSGFPALSLVRCIDGACLQSIALGVVNPDGSFVIASSESSPPIVPGSYLLRVNLDGYVPYSTPIFRVGADEVYDLKRLKIQPLTVRLDEPKICASVPAGRERCDHSVRLTNLVNRPVTVQTWRVFSLSGQPSRSSFQLDQARPVRLLPGQSRVLSYSLDIPRSMPEGAVLCVQFFAGRDERGFYFNPLASTYEFQACVLKQTDGTVRSLRPNELRELERLEARP